MARYILKLLSQSRVCDIRAGDYPDLLSVYNDALYGIWEFPRYIEEDGTETKADSFEILNAEGQLVLVVFVKDAFTQH
jgi:hypothetical protein